MQIQETSRNTLTQTILCEHPFRRHILGGPARALKPDLRRGATEPSVTEKHIM
ncbi:MAG: hypothetical protein RIN56_13960 [Sporomusaceae bacterium]|nr:hypothetical protein [Sporomusaceae bacterium]